MDTLAKIGNHGKAPKNCARDLKRVVQRGTTAPLPYMVPIPITEPKHNRVVEVEHPVLLPHEMIAYSIFNWQGHCQGIGRCCSQE